MVSIDMWRTGKTDFNPPFNGQKRRNRISDSGMNNTIRRWIPFFIVSVAILLGSKTNSDLLAQVDLNRPNVIVFLVDDLGWQDTSVAFSGEVTAFQKHFRTPNLERLARRGTRFVNAYAHCVCSPTRVSILTGQNPARHRVTNWTLHADRDSSGKTDRLGPPVDWNLQGLDATTPNLARLLQTSGYRTIHCGKAHWGAIGTDASDPLKLGFDVNIAGHAAGAPASYQGQENYGNDNDGTATSVWSVPGLKAYHGTDTHLTEALATEACHAIDQSITDDKNFFLYMAPYAVHTPIESHQRFYENYLGQNYINSEIAIPDVEAKYASMVQGFDAALGQILDTLTEKNIADKTIIVFTSDNGGLSAHTRDTNPMGTGKDTHCWPLKAGKGSAYEGGTRVPMVIAWATPDRGSELQKRIPVPTDSVCNKQVISEDLLPTICRWANVDVSADVSNSLDGIDFTSLIQNPATEEKSADAEPRKLLFHYPHVWGPKGFGYEPHSSLRHGKWKVIYFYDQSTWELYDLESDIGEQDNLVESNPKQLATMKAMLIEELNRFQPPYPTVIATGKPAIPQ